MARLKEHDEHCKQIAESIDFMACAECLATCPECDEVIDLASCEEREEDPEDLYRLHRCPSCGEWFDVDDATLYDAFKYLEDALDLDYVISCSKQYKAARVMLSFGGPTVYADTLSGKVKLYWWSEYGEAELSREAVAWLDEACEELYICC